jgi:RNA polymerase sigma-32 factor
MTTAFPVLADSLSLYMSEIRKFPLLTAEDEYDLAVRVLRDKDIEAAHRLITANLRFVVKVAAEYRSYGMKMLDLIQEGNIGLMMALKKYDPYRGIRLISYAVWWIRAYIQNYIISTWSLLKIGTTQAQKKLFFKLNQAKNAIRNMFGSDDAKAAAEALDVRESEIVEMDQRMRGEYSLDAGIGGEDGATFLEGLADERCNQEEALGELQESRQLQHHVGQVLAVLNEKERFIIEQRVTADEPLTLQDIATHFSISRERVRQIEEGALKKLKNALTPLLTHAQTA